MDTQTAKYELLMLNTAIYLQLQEAFSLKVRQKILVVLSRVL